MIIFQEQTIGGNPLRKWVEDNGLVYVRSERVTLVWEGKGEYFPADYSTERYKLLANTIFTFRETIEYSDDETVKEFKVGYRASSEADAKAFCLEMFDQMCSKYREAGVDQDDTASDDDILDFYLTGGDEEDDYLYEDEEYE